MSDTEEALSKLRDAAEALRRKATEAGDHRIWRSCRDLADYLDSLVRAAESAPQLTPRQIAAQALL